MKKTLIIFLTLFPLFLLADSWNNLTLKQAQQVTNFLKSEPFILDYCDCCDYKG